MYRAIVLTTLVLLMLAVAGVSVAHEGRIFADGPNGHGPPWESTTPEQTSFEASVEATGPEDETSPLPGATPETEDQRSIPEPTVVTEPTGGEPEKPTAAPIREQTPTPAANDVGNPGASGRGVGKPEQAVEVSERAAGSPDLGRPGKGKPEEPGNEGELMRGVGRQKAILCHEGDRTLTVGAPALAAHLRHGDTRGACQGEGSGPERSGETMGPEAARSGEGGGQDKMILCHKNGTIRVGAPAQAAHLRHGDSLGACR